MNNVFWERERSVKSNVVLRPKIVFEVLKEIKTHLKPAGMQYK